MRAAYHEKLAALSEQIGQMCGLAAAAIDNATRALLRADLALAERVITDHSQMVEMSVAAERSAVTLLALQQPVAGELRAIFGSSQIVADVDRMGALAVHVAKTRGSDIPATQCRPRSRAASPKWAGWRSDWLPRPRKCWISVIRTRPPACAETTT